MHPRHSLIHPTSNHGRGCLPPCLFVVAAFPRSQHRRYGTLGWLHRLVCHSFPRPFEMLSTITFNVRVHALTKFTPAYPNALMLLEPTVMFPSMSPTDPRSIHGAANVRGARAKRDTWPSRAEFKRWVRTMGKSIWARWDPRILDLYVVCTSVQRSESVTG